MISPISAERRRSPPPNASRRGRSQESLRPRFPRRMDPGKPWENHGKMLTSPRNMGTFHDFSTFGMANLEEFNEFSCLLLSFNVPPFLYVTFQRLRRAFTKVFHGLLLNHGGKPVIRSRRRPCDLQPSDVM